MSYNYNRTTLVGRLTKDPEIKNISDKTNKTNFTLAVDRPYKKEDGSYYTDFVNIIAWGKLAELGSKYLRKGMPVLVDGRLQVRNYEKNNQKRWITEIVADNVQLLSYPKTSEKSKKSEE
jgi:single-strand DNA-binding protein